MKIVSIFVIFLSVIIFSGISWWYQSPKIFYSFLGMQNHLLAASSVTNDYVLTSEDSGTTVTYPIGKEFTIVVDEHAFPKENWVISCSAPDSVERMGNLNTFILLPPLYGFR